MKKKKTLETRK